jgi:hypothetical protein
MLTKNYRVNINSLNSSENQIAIKSLTIEDYPNELELFNVVDNKKSLVSCETPDINNLTIHQNLIVRHSLPYGDFGIDFDKGQTYFENIEIIGIDRVAKVFSFTTDQYMILRPRSIVREIQEEKVYWYIYFQNGHYFSNEENITINICCNDTKYAIKNCIYADANSLRIEEAQQNVDLCGYMKNYVFGYSSNTNAEVFGNVGMFQVERTNVLYSTSDVTTFFYDRPVGKIQIPISQKFETDIYQNDIINDDFVDVETEKAINSIVDMEKDIYKPVILTSKTVKKDGKNTVTYERFDAYQIIFNLHFRQHRGDDWVADDDSFWNGTYVKDSKLYLMSDCTQGTNGFFSYPTNDNTVNSISSQSDLLTYLGFSNNDIKYQKNKLKKSFLRLSFYDSMNPMNQNLLAYSTIYLDSGLLFTKYIKNYESSDYRYSLLQYDESGKLISLNDNTKLLLKGIRCEREPYAHVNEKDALVDSDSVEDLRLSSQFVVKDQFNSNGSSEGFYLYIWKDNDNGVIPSNIYMKVEFNHAGYGRTIPMMMPYTYGSELKDDNGTVNEDKKKIKTFQEIIADWNENGYGIKKYLKYSYVHFKYQYDSTNKEHIYYLDNDTYGNSVNFTDNKIVLNLYEAKISSYSGLTDTQITDSSETSSDLIGVMKMTEVIDEDTTNITFVSGNDFIENTVDTKGETVPKTSTDNAKPYIVDETITQYIYSNRLSLNCQEVRIKVGDKYVTITDSSKYEFFFGDTNGLVQQDSSNNYYLDYADSDYTTTTAVTTVKLYVKYEGKIYTVATCTIYQKQADELYVTYNVTESGKTVTENLETYDFDKNNKSVEIEVISKKSGEDCQYVYEATDSEGNEIKWLTFDLTDNNTQKNKFKGKISVDENNVPTENKQGTITFTQIDGGKASPWIIDVMYIYEQDENKNDAKTLNITINYDIDGKYINYAYDYEADANNQDKVIEDYVIKTIGEDDNTEVKIYPTRWSESLDLYSINDDNFDDAWISIVENTETENSVTSEYVSVYNCDENENSGARTTYFIIEGMYEDSSSIKVVINQDGNGDNFMVTPSELTLGGDGNVITIKCASMTMNGNVITISDETFNINCGGNVGISVSSLDDEDEFLPYTIDISKVMDYVDNIDTSTDGVIIITFKENEKEEDINLGNLVFKQVGGTEEKTVLIKQKSAETMEYIFTCSYTYNATDDVYETTVSSLETSVKTNITSKYGNNKNGFENIAYSEQTVESGDTESWWVSYNTNKGDTYTIQENNTSSERSIIITFKQTGSGNTLKLKITQKAVEPENAVYAKLNVGLYFVETVNWKPLTLNSETIELTPTYLNELGGGDTKELNLTDTYIYSITLQDMPDEYLFGIAIDNTDVTDKEKKYRIQTDTQGGYSSVLNSAIIQTEINEDGLSRVYAEYTKDEIRQEDTLTVSAILENIGSQLNIIKINYKLTISQY